VSECVHKNNVSARRWASNKKALAAPDIFSRPRLPIVSLVSHSLWALFSIYRDAITVTSVSLTSICHRRIWRMHLFSPDKSTKGTCRHVQLFVFLLSRRGKGCESGAVCGHWRGFAQHFCNLLQTLVSDGTHSDPCCECDCSLTSVLFNTNGFFQYLESYFEGKSFTILSSNLKILERAIKHFSLHMINISSTYAFSVCSAY
jgi:hypothetical protein